jgi:hypothetical protein
MEGRAPKSEAFPVTLCQVLLPTGARRVQIGGATLPTPKAEPRRIVVFGDTGCRLKGALIQDCNDPRAWTFPQVARLAAAHHPDLVIHVGDYYYRESPCPAARAGCGGSPWGDNWTTWDADFFAPASPLLGAAPWVMARGNHESCERGGAGWFLLLDGAERPLACPAAAAPMAIDIGGVTLELLDSADTVDQFAPADKVAQFAGQFDALKGADKGQPIWIVTHRPVWGLVPVVKLGPVGPVETPINATEQAALKGKDLSRVEMVVSGHIHHFASFSFLGDRPAQLVAGTGGDSGESGDRRSVVDTVRLDGMGAARFGLARYGFLVLDREGADWAGTFFDFEDRPIARCRLHVRDLACALEHPRGAR